MSDLIAFLAARLDEREHEMPEMLWGETAADNDLDDRRARTLREVEAKRAILARYGECLALPGARDRVWEYEDVVLPHLAIIYRDHPDYQQEWKP